MTPDYTQCRKLWLQALNYIARHESPVSATLEDWLLWGGTAETYAVRPAPFQNTYQPLIHNAAFMAAEDVLNAAMLAGDVEATKQACRSVWIMVIDYIKQERG